MTREDMTQMDLELAKMEGAPVTSTPAHRPPPAEESEFISFNVSSPLFKSNAVFLFQKESQPS
jgi:hypothetical protein